MSFGRERTKSLKESLRSEENRVFASRSFVTGDVDDVFSTQTVSKTPSPPLIYSRGFFDFSSEQNGKDFDGGFGESDGPILPPPSEMQSEEGFALREK